MSALGACCLAAAAAYLSAWRRARLEPWRACAFLAGLASLRLAGLGRLAALEQALLVGHMARHLLLALAAPPLLLLGAPLLAAARAVPSLERRLGPNAAPTRAAVLLTHPVAAGILMVGVTLAWHLPRPFALAMDSAFWHAVEDASFLLSGLLFWWPVILPWPSSGRWSGWAIPLYLLAADMPVSMLSAYLAFTGHPVYRCYAAAGGAFGLSALDDQAAAGMLMWTAMLVVFLGAAIAAVYRELEPRADASSF